ncbi:DUF397 domain-containing protein [Streptomyces sp. NPDC005562]|uniref:DUF397 domain-containing protein n=1 Tax=Streptomyces sp. NPDC005562 TaxID=3154890 RepID=UPI0033AFA4F7
MTEFTQWRKASYSGGEGEACVEQRRHLQVPLVDVRDSKEGDKSPILTFANAAWASFVDDLRTSDNLSGGYAN